MNIKFTKRELQLIHLISEGLENKEVASMLYLSVRTIESHRKNILQKLNAKNFYSVLTFAFKNKILKID